MVYSVYSVDSSFVLLSFLFLFFRKDFLRGIELPHDAVPASRSDDNRRAAGGHPNFQQSRMPCLPQILRILELPHEIFYNSRSDDNRRAAGAVNLSAFTIHYIQTKHTGVCRPGGEAFCLFCVFCGLQDVNFSCFSCLSWFQFNVLVAA